MDNANYGVDGCIRLHFRCCEKFKISKMDPVYKLTVYVFDPLTGSVAHEGQKIIGSRIGDADTGPERFLRDY